MYRSKLITILIAMLALDVVVSKALSDDEAGWVDTYYQYRIPVVVEAKEAGWNAVSIDASAITLAINKNEELKFDPLWFAWNQLKVVEVDNKGKLINSKVNLFSAITSYIITFNCSFCVLVVRAW